MLWRRFFVLSLVAIALGGCGFRSLYGEHSHGDVREMLASVFVDPIEDRAGQIMRNELIDLLNPLGTPRNPRYRLSVRLAISEISYGVEASALSTRANLEIGARFGLIERRKTDEKGGVAWIEEFNASRKVVAGYNVFSSDFSTYEAKRDAEVRAIRELAKEIQAQISIYLAQSR